VSKIYNLLDLKDDLIAQLVAKTQNKNEKTMCAPYFDTSILFLLVKRKNKLSQTWCNILQSDD
jgi:hypothetical protein